MSDHNFKHGDLVENYKIGAIGAIDGVGTIGIAIVRPSDGKWGNDVHVWNCETWDSSDCRPYQQASGELVEAARAMLENAYQNFGVFDQKRVNKDVLLNLEKALANPDQPQAKEYEYAKHLAVTMHEMFYRGESTSWEPCDDLTGVLTQIDNMVSGLCKRDEPQGWIIGRQPWHDETHDGWVLVERNMNIVPIRASNLRKGEPWHPHIGMPPAPVERCEDCAHYELASDEDGNNESEVCWLRRVFDPEYGGDGCEFKRKEES